MERDSLEMHIQHTQNTRRLQFGPVQISMNIFTEIRIPPCDISLKKELSLPEIQKLRDNAHYHFLPGSKDRANDDILILSRTNHHGMPK
jgi:hypothetical protein